MAYTMEDYVLKEPQVLEKILASFPAALPELPQKVKRILILATGSSLNAALAAKYYLEEVSGALVSLEEPYNYRHYGSWDPEIDLVVALSQSGKSSATIEALAQIEKKGVATLGITADLNSPFGKMATPMLDLGIGIETMGYVTLGYSATVLNLWLLGLALACGERGEEAIGAELAQLAAAVRALPETIAAVQSYLERHRDVLTAGQRLVAVGYGAGVGVAKEFETKLTETIRLPTSGHELEAYMHGPYLEAQPSHLLFFFEDNTESARRMAALAHYFAPHVGGIFTIGHDPGRSGEDHYLCLPGGALNPLVLPLIQVVFPQLAAHNLARWLDIDLAIDPFPDFDMVLKSKINE